MKKTLKLIVMTLLAIVILLPIAWMVLSSFKPESEIFKHTTFDWHYMIPEHWTLKNYIAVFTNSRRPLGRYILNSAFIAITGTVLGLIVNSFAAFAFSKMHFPFRKFTFGLFLMTLAIPFEAIMVPQYMIIRNLGWLNTYRAIIIPQIVWAFGIFLLMQFFSDIPDSLIEAARMDGASWFKIFTDVAIPNARPTLITLGIMTFSARWDEFMWALIVISDDSKQVIQIAVASYSTEVWVSWGDIFAASVVASIPTMLIFFLLQKYYIEGVTSTGIK